MQQLDNAIKYFNEKILNELLANEIKAYVAGGAVRDYFMGKLTKTDYDLFFPNEQEYLKCETYMINRGGEVLWESSNGKKIKYNNNIFDLVKFFFETPIDAINAFDFTVSMFCVDNGKVYYGESSFIDLAKRQLMINKITFPTSTLNRAFKYYKKGFIMCKGEMKKLIVSINNMEKIELLEESENESSGNFFKGFD